ncbi:MAG: tetratricopeptide repeat protein [Verrucomicrobia bacterium]|nr:tetratricopeptide repeat protein [Verrucomicrobiota bacterium]
MLPFRRFCPLLAVAASLTLMQGVIAAQSGEAPAAALSPLEQEIATQAGGLGCDDATADAFARQSASWKSDDGESVLVALKAKLDTARSEIGADAPADRRAGLATAEAAVAKELALTIQREIKQDYRNGGTLLAQVIESKTASGLGSAQLTSVLGRAIGLASQVISITYPLPDRQPVKQAHAACLVRLCDGRVMMIDLSFGPILSDPFTLDKLYGKAGSVFELREAENAPGLHRRFRMLDDNGLRAMVYVARGVAEAAAERYEPAVALHSQAFFFDADNPILYRNRALAYTLLGEHAKALEDLGRAVSLDPQYADAVLGTGFDYHCQDKPDKAIEYYTKTIELNPHYAVAFYDRGMLREARGDLDGALDDYNTAVKVDPNDFLAFYNRGLYFLRRGQNRKAVADCMRAIDLNPGYAWSYHNRGIAYRNLGRTREAVADCTKALELDPKNAGALVTRSDLYIQSRQLDEAMADLDRAIELDPDNSMAYNNRGVVYDRMSRPGMAHREWQKAVELDPKNAIAWHNQCDIFLQVHMFDEAIEVCTRAIEADPTFMSAYRDRGRASAGLGKSEEAIADFTKAIELAPEDIELRLYRADAYHDAGKLDEAIADLSEAIKRNRTGAGLYYKRGLWYAERDEKDSAAKDLEKAVALDEDFTEDVEAAADEYDLDVDLDD